MSSRAEVTITVLVTNVGTWGDDCTAKQIREQATEAALGKLRRQLQGADSDCRIVGSPDVKMIQTDLT